jgi:FkbM family methyltransferase
MNSNYLSKNKIKKQSLKSVIKRIKGFIFFKYISLKRFLSYNYLKIISKNGFFLKEVEGSKMLLDLRDKGISLELALDGIRERMSTKNIYKEIKKGDIVIDIGANIGYYVLIESKIVGKKGKVYAIEPVPKNFEMLKKNIEINKCSNIEMFELAIGDKKCLSEINLSSRCNWSSMIYLKEADVKEKINVNVNTLDNFIKDKKYPNFIRMDVEGYEYNILKGMESIFKNKKPLKIFIELHPHIMKRKKTLFVLNTLKNNGFEIRSINKSWTKAQQITKGNPPNYSFNKIDDLIVNESLLCGKLGAFEIFFEKNK